MVGKGTSGGECYGTYSSTSQTGSGTGYINACIHSGANDYTSGNTVWYDYVTASAGTIKNSSSSDTTGTTIVATESICPRGWTLPTNTQTRSIGPDSGSTAHVSSFSPVIGGHYNNGTLRDESTLGYWWGSTASNTALRYGLSYDGSNLQTNSLGRRLGIYIRCVSEEKDVSDLTYMQDMTPSVAANITMEKPSRLTIGRSIKLKITENKTLMLPKTEGRGLISIYSCASVSSWLA